MATDRMATSDAILLIMKALSFAACKHMNHRRKGKFQEPYINHLVEVAEMVARATGGRDPVAVAAALLHDVVEDTETEREELEQEFGSEIATIVAELTKDKHLSRDENRKREVQRVKTYSPRARIIRLADKLNNLQWLDKSPPAKWSPERCLDYVHFARRVVAVLRGTDAELEAQFEQLANKLEARFK